MAEQGRWLGSIVRGYFGYHAVPTNARALNAFRHHLIDIWRRALRRRSQKDRTRWDDTPNGAGRFHEITALAEASSTAIITPMTPNPDPLDALRRFDLNLLVAFDVLIAERSVTAAARRMGVGQPAMSSSLARLRDMFGDPLLIRTSAGMQPTGRALELVEPISRILAQLRKEVLGGRTFRPETDQRQFRIGVSDQAEAALMQEMLHVIARDAPGVSIVVRSVEMRLGADLLATGAIDLALGYFPEVAGELEVATLYHETFVCLFDAKACGVEAPLSLEAYVALPHILVSLRGEPYGHVDELLSAVGRKRTVVYTTPHFLAVPFLLHGFRAVSAVPRHLAENCADAAGLSICPVPLPSSGYDVRMVWHRRTASDPAHTWFRGVVAAIGQGRV